MTMTAALRPHLHTPPTAAPCPAWCTDLQGHGFDSESPQDNAPMRAHGHTFGTRDIGVDVHQLAAWRDDVERPIDAPAVRVWIAGDAHETDLSSPEQARRLAAALMEAADLLEQVQA